MTFEELLYLVQGEPVFDASLLLAGSVSLNAIRVQLSRWVKAGKLIQLRRGLYAISSPFQKSNGHPFLFANYIKAASYVSLQTALSFYNLIPDFGSVTSSVTTGRPGRIENKFGVFTYRHIKNELFFAYRYMTINKHACFIAEPEKALLDLIHLQPKGDTLPYLKELRLQNLNQIDMDAMRNFAQHYKSPKINRAIKNLLLLVNDEEESYEDL